MEVHEVTPTVRGQGCKMISIAGVELEVFERGQGAPILYLHGGGGIGLDLPFLELLAKERRVIAPSHPGFGKSSLPDWLDSVDDIAHIYLELMDRLEPRRAPISSASRSAAGSPPRSPPRCRSGIDRLVLIGPVGVKTGTPDKLDIPDIFAMPQDEARPAALPRSGEEPGRPRDACPTRSCIIVARNRETLALLTWEPYMHNPKLKHRLHRVERAGAVRARRERRHRVGRISRSAMRRSLPNARDR